MTAHESIPLCCLLLIGCATSYARSPAPQTIVPNRPACSFVTDSDAESILGTPVTRRGDGTFQCWFVEAGFTSVAPKNHQVNFGVRYLASPDPNLYLTYRKNIIAAKGPADVVKELTDFADAAIWKWTPGWGGSLTALYSGTVEVDVTISGLPEDSALKNAEMLAARVGGNKATGYAYLRKEKAAPAQPPRVAAAAPARATSPAVAGFVRKSKDYWADYDTDLIRQVFDGGFGIDVDDSTQFHVLFTSYVEQFSQSCRNNLPAQRVSLGVSQSNVQRDGNGRIVGQRQDQSFTVEADPRFAGKYRQYIQSLRHVRRNPRSRTRGCVGQS